MLSRVCWERRSPRFVSERIVAVSSKHVANAPRFSLLFHLRNTSKQNKKWIIFIPVLIVWLLLNRKKEHIFVKKKTLGLNTVKFVSFEFHASYTGMKNIFIVKIWSATVEEKPDTWYQCGCKYSYWITDVITELQWEMCKKTLKKYDQIICFCFLQTSYHDWIVL